MELAEDEVDESTPVLIRLGEPGYSPRSSSPRAQPRRPAQRILPPGLWRWLLLAGVAALGVYLLICLGLYLLDQSSAGASKLQAGRQALSAERQRFWRQANATVRSLDKETAAEADLEQADDQLQAALDEERAGLEELEKTENQLLGYKAQRESEQKAEAKMKLEADRFDTLYRERTVCLEELKLRQWAAQHPMAWKEAGGALGELNFLGNASGDGSNFEHKPGRVVGGQIDARNMSSLPEAKHFCLAESPRCKSITFEIDTLTPEGQHSYTFSDNTEVDQQAQSWQSYLLSC